MYWKECKDRYIDVPEQGNSLWELPSDIPSSDLYEQIEELESIVGRDKLNTLTHILNEVLPKQATVNARYGSTLHVRRFMHMLSPYFIEKYNQHLWVTKTCANAIMAYAGYTYSKSDDMFYFNTNASGKMPSDSEQYAKLLKYSPTNHLNTTRLSGKRVMVNSIV